MAGSSIEVYEIDRSQLKLGRARLGSDPDAPIFESLHASFITSGLSSVTLKSVEINRPVITLQNTSDGISVGIDYKKEPPSSGSTSEPHQGTPVPTSQHELHPSDIFPLLPETFSVNDASIRWKQGDIIAAINAELHAKTNPEKQTISLQSKVSHGPCAATLKTNIELNETGNPTFSGTLIPEDLPALLSLISLSTASEPRINLTGTADLAETSGTMQLVLPSTEFEYSTPDFSITFTISGISDLAMKGNKPDCSGRLTLSVSTLRIGSEQQPLKFKNLAELNIDIEDFNLQSAVLKLTLPSTTCEISDEESGFSTYLTVNGAMKVNLKGEKTLCTGTISAALSKLNCSPDIAELNFPEFITLEIHADQSGFSLNGPVTIDKALPIQVALNGTFKPSFSIESRITMPPTDISQDLPLIKTLGLLPEGLSLSGNVGLDCTSSWENNTLTRPSAVVSLQNGALSLAEPPVNLTDINTTFALKLIPDLRSEPAQRLSMGPGNVDIITFNGAELVFSVESLSSFFIESGSLRSLGGDIRLYSMRIAENIPTGNVVLYAEGLDLEKVFLLFNSFQGKGKGRLYGRLPVRFRDKRIELQNAYLYSPPGEKGILQVKNLDVIKMGLQQASLPNDLQNRILSAFNDLEYSVLKMDLNVDDPENARMTFQIYGNAREDKSLPPLDLKINVNAPLQRLFNLGMELNEL